MKSFLALSLLSTTLLFNSADADHLSPLNEDTSFSFINGGKTASSLCEEENQNTLKASTQGWGEWISNKAWEVYENLPSFALLYKKVQDKQNEFYQDLKNVYIFSLNMLWHTSNENSKTPPQEIAFNEPDDIPSSSTPSLIAEKIEQTDHISSSPEQNTSFENMGEEMEEPQIDTLKLPEIMAHLIVQGIEGQNSYILRTVAQKDLQTVEKYKKPSKNLLQARRKASYIRRMQENWVEVSHLKHETKNQPRVKKTILRGSIYKAP